MNKKTLQILEYNKIIEHLVEFAGSTLAKEHCRALLPSSNLEEIQQAQKETRDAIIRLEQKGYLSFQGIYDIRGSLKRLEIGGILSTRELLEIAHLQEICERIKNYGCRDISEEQKDSLDDRFVALMILSEFVAEIRHCIPSEEEISDNASPGLRQVRRAIRHVNDKIHTKLSSMVTGSARTYLQDAVVTMRNGRFCIPVKAAYKTQIPGLVHDQSSSGSTLFVEPTVVMKLNNELRELEIQEEKEIQKILASLSTMAAENLSALSANVRILTELDFIFAKAKLSMSYDGSEPLFNESRWVDIRKGRHPLLNKRKAVPIDIRLGKEYRLLIITGPNTGGKTVSLKTVGLLTLMGQAGLHIPALPGSELSVFEEVYSDIGDEQSIEQSLSTFSSHMMNVIEILKKANEKSLVLFDELGAGTDPVEGAALATAILESLRQRGICTMATTHYSELKVYALATPGVENGCCEFDVETLRPTYRLLIGIPGRSNAFAISEKLGIPPEIIADAKDRMAEEKDGFSDLLRDLEQSRLIMEKERKEAEARNAKAAALEAELERKTRKLEEEREQILRETNEKAEKILRDVLDCTDKFMKKLSKYEKDASVRKNIEQEQMKLKEKLAVVEPPADDNVKESKAFTLAELKIGMPVRVRSMDLAGTVISLPNSKGDLYVQMGAFRSRVNWKDLERSDEEKTHISTENRTGIGKIRMSKSLNVSSEINLKGKNVDDALTELDKYLDDAVIAHVPQVRIVHGKGTGILRKAVHNYLRHQKNVNAYHLGEPAEGGEGVTIVTIKI